MLTLASSSTEASAEMTRLGPSKWQEREKGRGGKREVLRVFSLGSWQVVPFTEKREPGAVAWKSLGGSTSSSSTSLSERHLSGNVHQVVRGVFCGVGAVWSLGEVDDWRWKLRRHQLSL